MGDLASGIHVHTCIQEGDFSQVYNTNISVRHSITSHWYRISVKLEL